jgi:hypothetical protein
MVTKQEEVLLRTVESAPIFGLKKWREEHGLTGKDWAAYNKAVAIKIWIVMAIGFILGAVWYSYQVNL